MVTVYQQTVNIYPMWWVVIIMLGHLSRSYSYSRYCTKTSMKWRLVQGIPFYKENNAICIEKSPCSSLSSNQVPAQHRQYHKGSIGPQLLQGNGNVAQQTSKEQTEMSRFTLKGPRLGTIFCFAFIHKLLCKNYTIKTFLLVCSSDSSK